MAERSIHDMESEATVIAHKGLTKPLKAAIDVLNLATKLQANDVPAEKLPKAAIVRVLLLQRVQNDLRCCVILVEHGYPLQAIALAAGIFEAWVTIAAIKTEADAEKWLLHDQESESFDRIRPLTKRALEHILGDDTEAEKIYRQYQQLCMPKHLNPIVERGRGYAVQGHGIQFRPGRETSKLLIQHGWYALERAARFANIALFTIAHSQETSTEMHLALIAQQAALDELQEESARRWPENYRAQS